MKEVKYTVKWTARFKKDYKQALKRNLNIEKLHTIVKKFAKGEKLPDENYDHPLGGNLSGHRECHIEPDWLLVYFCEKDILVLTLSRTGTHSDLFGK